MSCFVLLPNNLFENSIEVLHQYDHVIMLEDSIFFSDYPNVIKSAYLYSAIHFYIDYLKKNSINVFVFSTREGLESYLRSKKIKRLSFFNPTDYEIKKYLYKLKHLKIKEYDTQLFILKESDISEKIYYSNASFMKKFDWGKSYDTENRNKLPREIQIPDNIVFDMNKFYSEGIKRAKLLHNDDTIDVNILRLYPVTFNDSKKNLNYFLHKKLGMFGTYQDAIEIDEVYIFHSNISSSLNIGLITPTYVYESVLKFVKNTPTISVNNVEGFLRQVLGWREYIRYIYINFYEDILKNNIWESKYKLKWEYWNGKKDTGIDFIDNEIKKCIKYSYSHHIVRLMIFLNVFVLLEIDPNEVLKWFMQICSIDAYKWCMIPNIWIMGYYDDRFMHKPYLSSSNYISKMSKYEKNKIFDALFYTFLNKKKDKIKKHAGIYLRNLSYYERLDKESKENIDGLSMKFIGKVRKK